MTTLTNLLNRMGNYTPIFNIEEARKVSALEEAIRGVRRTFNPPWTLQKSTLKTFNGIFLYPVASDHSHLAYLDNQNTRDYENKERFVYTSIQEFWEDPTNRNQMAEIWDAGTKMLGINLKDFQATQSIVADTQSLTSPVWTSSGDAGTLVLDSVQTKSNPNYSVRVPIVASSNVATIETTFPTIIDANYKRKWFFTAVYLSSVPTSIQLKFGLNSSNYLTTTVTSQFSGQAFKANDWNIIGFDLNAPTIVGTQTTSFTYQAIIFNGASTGTYYIDTSFLRGWLLLDYWYYSSNNIKLTGTTNLNQQYFTTSASFAYDVNDSLLGDDEWSDVIVYEACSLLLADAKETAIKSDVENRKSIAWANFFNLYPDLQPLIISTYYRHTTDYQEDFINIP